MHFELVVISILNVHKNIFPSKFQLMLNELFYICFNSDI